MEESYHEAEDSKNEKFEIKSKEINEKIKEKEDPSKLKVPPQMNPQLGFVPMQAPYQLQNFANPPLLPGNNNQFGIQQFNLSTGFPSYPIAQPLSQPQAYSYTQSQIIGVNQPILSQNQFVVQPLSQGISSSITPKPVSQNLFYYNPITIQPQQNQAQTLQNATSISNNIQPLQQNRLLRQYTPKVMNITQQPITMVNPVANTQIVNQVPIQSQAYYPNYQAAYIPYQNLQGQYIQQQYAYPSMFHNAYTISDQAYVNSSIIQPTYINPGQFQYQYYLS